MDDLTLIDALDASALRSAYGRFPSGVTALAALVDGERYGMSASSFTSVSLEPALVTVCIQNASSTWPRIRAADRIGVSVLAEDQGGTCRRLAVKDSDRFTGVDHHVTPNGAILLDGAALWLECEIHDEIEAGDHLVVLLRVRAVRSLPDVSPLVFHDSRFRALRRPDSVSDEASAPRLRLATAAVA